MIIDYFFGYRCPIWPLSSLQGCWWDPLGLTRHQWLAKWWKIDQVLPILVVEWGFETIGYAYLLHKTYFRPIHFYPTTLIVGAVYSGNEIDQVTSLTGWKPYSTAYEQLVLDITNSVYLQEKCCVTVYLFFTRQQVILHYHRFVESYRSV